MDLIMHMIVWVRDTDLEEIKDVKKHIEQYSYSGKVIIRDNFTTEDEC